MKLLKQQEFVVGGWTEPRQTRQHFGSLLIGYYDDGGALRWAGAVGTGFDQKELDRVAGLLRPTRRRTARSMTRSRPPNKRTGSSPTLVAEVRFTEWTSDGLLRQPVYLGTREDKRAKQITPRGSGQREVRSQRAKGGTKDRRAKAGERADKGAGSSLDALVERLQELEDSRKDGDMALPNGDTVRVTNLAKVFWPELKITKGDLLRYYVQASPLDPAGARRSAARDETVSERRRQAVVLSAAASGSRAAGRAPRGAPGRTSIRRTKRARAIG